MAEEYLLGLWRKRGGTVGQEKDRGAHEGAKQKLLLTPQKGRGVRVEISSKQDCQAAG